MIKKRPDWQNEFQEFVEFFRWKPFEWGEWDCCKFADAAIFSFTGEHVIPKTLTWTDEDSAKTAIKDYGKTLLGSLSKACKLHGLASIPTAMMTTGDLILFKSQQGVMVGISDGYGILAPSDDGITVHLSESAMKAWRVPA